MLAERIGINSEDLEFGHPGVLPLDAFFRAGHPYQKDIPFGTDIFHSASRRFRFG